MRNFDNLSINYFFAHACTQYFPCLITTENNKNKPTFKQKQKFKTMKTSKQKNKTKTKNKNKKTGFVTEIA